jgi:TonB family protein
VSASALRFERSRLRTRGSMAASVALHALLLLWLVLTHREDPLAGGLTEIAWLDESSLGEPAPAAVPADAPQAHEQSFRRLERHGELEPQPQSDIALDDRMNARLASLQASAAAAPVLPTAAPSSALSAPAAVAGGKGAGGVPLALHRGGTGTGPALELTRGGHAGAGLSPAVVATGLPAQRAAASPAAAGETMARRALAGAALMGPVADRPILAQVTPVYPEWAKREAVEGSVTLYFVVRSDGTVKENVLVQKTAGFQDFDESALAALRVWRFQPLGGGRTGEQWGTITFHFRLRDAG